MGSPTRQMKVVVVAAAVAVVVVVPGATQVYFIPATQTLRQPQPMDMVQDWRPSRPGQTVAAQVYVAAGAAPRV